jgi:hypothetical protein
MILAVRLEQSAFLVDVGSSPLRVGEDTRAASAKGAGCCFVCLHTVNISKITVCICITTNQMEFGVGIFGFLASFGLPRFHVNILEGIDWDGGGNNLKLPNIWCLDSDSGQGAKNLKRNSVNPFRAV